MGQAHKRILAGVLVVVAVVLSWRAFVLLGDRATHLADSSDADDRLEAAVLLGQEDQEPNPALLRKLAGDPDRKVAMQAIITLGKQPTDANHQALQGLLTAATDPFIKGAAAAALGRYPQTDPQRLVPFVNDVRTAPEVRVGAAKGLATLCQHRTRQKQTVPHLVEALRHRDPQVRIWAIRGIYNATGHLFPGYNAKIDPDRQKEVLAFIEGKLREEKLLR